MIIRYVVLVSCVAVSASTLPAGGPAKDDKAWRPLFDGKTLKGWKSTNFGGEGEVSVEDGAIVMERGSNMTGVTYDGKDFPKTNYELAFEAKRTQGLDFFCTTTFPVGDDPCSLVVAGWSGAVVGLSSIDGKDASENETRKNMGFDNNRWYKVKIRVTPEKIVAWIDDAKVVDFATKGRKISIRPECDPSRPLGICTYSSVGHVKNIRVRNLTAGE
jgi:hypothetical protein